MMHQRTQRSISIKQQILSKLKLNEIQGNPICPINKPYRMNTKKVSRRIPTIEQQIFSTTSIKLIKPYKTQKLINIQPTEYSICTILKSDSYKKLQNQLTSMMTTYSKEKKQLSRETKQIDTKIQEQTQKTTVLCRKLMNLDNTYDRMENQYYEVKRHNYQLRAQLSARRQVMPMWNFTHNRQSVGRQQEIDLDRMSYQQILEMEEILGKHNVGLGQKSIAKLTVNKLKELNKHQMKDNQKEELNCCICCDQVQENHNVIQLQCAHIHHASCIKEWLKIKRFCPLCKGQVVVN